MNIQGIPLNDGGLRRIGDKSTEKVSTDRLKKADSVKIFRSARNDGIEVNAQFTVPEDFPVRVELVERIKERVNNGAYNHPELLENIAETIVDFVEMPDNGTVPVEAQEVRGETVNRVDEQVEQSYYDRPEVMEEIVERLIYNLGLMDFL